MPPPRHAPRSRPRRRSARRSRRRRARAGAGGGGAHGRHRRMRGGSSRRGTPTAPPAMRPCPRRRTRRAIVPRRPARRRRRLRAAGATPQRGRSAPAPAPSRATAPRRRSCKTSRTPGSPRWPVAGPTSVRARCPPPLACACGDRRHGGRRRGASPQGRRRCGQRAVRDPLRRAVHLLECWLHCIGLATSAARAGRRLPRQPETSFRARSPTTHPAPARTMPRLRGRDRSRARGSWHGGAARQAPAVNCRSGRS
jgi:hypothetical protein